MRTRFGLGTRRSRAAVAVGLLLSALVLAGVLAYQAYDAARSHRAMAETTVEEYATFAAWEYTGTARRDLHAKAVKPGLDIAAIHGGKDPGAPFGPEAVVDSVARAWGWPHEGRWDYFFRLDLATGRLDRIGPVAPEPAELRWLRDTLSADPEAAYDEDWEQGARLVGPSDDRRLLAYRIYPGAREEARTVYGFRSDLGAYRYVLAKIFDVVPLLPSSLTNGFTSPEFLSVTVRGPGDEVFFASSSRFDSPYAAGDTVGAAFGGLSTRVAVRPEAAEHLVIGGLPGSRLPLLLGLLALTAAMVVAGIFQLRREHELAILRADFVSGVSHELRTPLAQIRMFAETLLLGRVRSDEEERRSLEILVKEARRLGHQVDNVLLFSRAEREGMRLSPESVDVTELLSDVAESFGPLAAAAGCRLELELEEGVRGRVDPVAFPQAVINLLDNAVKYGPAGEPVRLRLAPTPAGFRVTVDDRGPGIPEEDRERIWEAYSRLERDRESAVAGSGIGLAVVREVVEGHGGRVWVEDGPGTGARFVLELPAEEEGFAPPGGRVPDPGAPAKATAEAP